MYNIYDCETDNPQQLELHHECKIIPADIMSLHKHFPQMPFTIAPKITFNFLVYFQSQLEGLPKVIAQSLIAHQQEQQDQRYLPADCGPTVRRFSPPSRRRRHFPVPLNNSSSQI